MPIDETDDEVIETCATEDDQEAVETNDNNPDEGELDVDDITLAEAQKALEDESDGVEDGETSEESATEEAKATDDETPAAADGDTPAAEATDDAGSAPSIPKPRFDHVLNERDEAIKAAAYWRGVADARVATGGDDETTVTKTPEEQVTELRAEKTAFAEKFDNGEMSQVEFEAERDRIDDAVLEVRQAAAAPATQQKPTETRPVETSDSLYLEDQTDKIEAEHPYSTLIKSDADWNFLGVKAVETLAEQGHVLPPGKLNQRDQLLLRKSIAVLTDTYGPAITGIAREDLPKAGESAATEGKTTTSTEPSDIAKARARKIELAKEHPSDIAEMGEASSTDKDPTPAQIEAMSDEEIMELPDATRRRIQDSQAA